MTVRLALLCAVLALMFAACGGDDETASSSSSTATPEATATQDADAGGEEGETEEEREREEAEAREAGGKECSEVGDIDGEPKDQPPSDVTILEGAKVYEAEGPFGKTERFLAAVDGDAEELPEKRDAAAKALEEAGYSIRSTDQEEGAEAEAHLEGNGKTVDIQVTTLCAGKLRIRYTVS